MKIQVRNEDFILHPSRSVYWPRQKILMVADIHLGKAQTFMKNGYWLPPAAHANDLETILKLTFEFPIERVVFIGDFIHSREGLTDDLIQEFADWQKKLSAQITVIVGNHDRPAVKAWPKLWNNFELTDAIHIENFTLQHEPPSKKTINFTWCGHIHPKVKLKQGADHLYLPSFVISPDTGYLPAFSSLAGGAQFAYQKSNRYFVSGEQDVVEVVF